MAVPPIKRGARLTTKLVNGIIAQANRVDRFDPGAGRIASVGPGGIQLSDAAMAALMREPAQSVIVVNAGTVAIDAFAPAGIIESCAVTDGELLNQRALKVRVPKAEDAGNFVIAQDRIEAGGAGWAWCSGTCLVRLYRWFDAEILERADILATQRYALATLDGGLDILWAQRTDLGAPIVGQEHFAVCRFNGQRFYRWYNAGSVDVPLGSPIVTTVTDTDGLISGTVSGVLNCRAPLAADNLLAAFVNVGGTVAAGAYGRCTTRDAMVRTKASYNAAATVGPEASQTSMSSVGSGYQVMARLGAYQSVEYAIVRGGVADSRVFHLQIIDGQTAYSSGATTYYGAQRLVGTLATVPSLYDPNSVGATPGLFTATQGICRCILWIDGVQQAGFVLGVHDTRAGNLISSAVFNGEYVETFPAAVSIPLASDATQTITAYRFRFM